MFLRAGVLNRSSGFTSCWNRAQRSQQPQSGAGVVFFPITLVFSVLRVTLARSIRVAAHALKRQGLHTSGKSRIRVSIFNPAVDVQQEITSESLSQGRQLGCCKEQSHLIPGTHNDEAIIRGFQ